MSRFTVTMAATGQAFDAAADESLLAAATRAGVAIPHDCQLGGCGTCRVRVLDGRVDYEELPMALGEDEAAAGFALACQARARSNLVLQLETASAPASEPQRQRAVVEQVRPLTADIVSLSLQLPDADAGFVYRPGQYMNVLLDDGSHRSFSMASAPAGNRVDFQVRRVAGGRFTDTALSRLAPGDSLQVELPHGSFCCRTQDYRPMLMVATGTGLAPIRAMLESLCEDDDCPPVSLYWGMRTEADLYLGEEIARWQQRLFEFSYVPVLSRPDAGWTGRRGHVQQAVAQDFDDLSEFSVYLCGSPQMIDQARAVFATRGADPAFVYTDSFLFQHQF